MLGAPLLKWQGRTNFLGRFGRIEKTRHTANSEGYIGPEIRRARRVNWIKKNKRGLDQCQKTRTAKGGMKTHFVHVHDKRQGQSNDVLSGSEGEGGLVAGGEGVFSRGNSGHSLKGEKLIANCSTVRKRPGST